MYLVCSPIDVSSILDVTSINVDNQGPIQFSVWLSFAEIYNEHVFDLLEPISMGKDGKRTVLKVGDDRKGNPYIKGNTVDVKGKLLISKCCVILTHLYTVLYFFIDTRSYRNSCQ